MALLSAVMLVGAPPDPKGGIGNGSDEAPEGSAGASIKLQL